MICNYDFQLKKDGSPRKRCFCAHPELIKNYDLAMKDKENVWYCHHKLEAFFSMKELKEMGRYYNVTARELVFVRDQNDHFSWPHKGYDGRFTEEVRLKISESKRGKSSWMKGKHHSEEAKRKNSEAHKGKPSWNKGKHFSADTKKKMSKNRTDKIKVQCVETGQIFESIGKAIAFIGLKDNGSIRRVLDKPGLTAAGYHWKHVL